MRRSWAAVSVGLLFVVVVGAAYAIFKYTSERMATGEGYVVFGRFRDALGLYEKSRVLSAGLQVGQIEGRSLDADTGKARVNVRLYPWVKIYDNAIMSKKAASLLGEFYIDIDPGMAVTVQNKQRITHRVLIEGDEVKHIGEQTSTSTIIDQVGETLPILKDILRDVHGLTSGPVKQIADNANKLIERNSEVLERLLNRVDDIAANIQSITRSETDDIKIAIKNVREITDGLKGLVGTAQGEVSGTGTELRNSLQKIQSSVGHLDKSLQNIEKITDKVAGGEGTIGHLVNDDQIARNVESITEDAGRLLGGVSRLQTIVGLRTEYNYLAKTFKNSFQITLAPTPDKFYLVELVDDPRGFREPSTTVSSNSQSGFVSDTTIKTSEKLRITFQFGKRIGPVAGRFGIKESTGGIGSDVFLFDDRLMLSADLFDTRSNVRPRLTGRGSLAVYKRNVFLTGGVDDVMNYTRAPGLGGQFFDWFFGAHLIFNDEDLKSLLFFGGGGAASGAAK